MKEKEIEKEETVLKFVNQLKNDKSDSYDSADTLNDS